MMIRFRVLHLIRTCTGLMALGAATVMACEELAFTEQGCPPLVVAEHTMAAQTLRAIHHPQLVRISQRPTEIHIRFGDEDDHRVLINSVAYPVKEDNTIFRTKIITDQPERLFVIGQYREGGKTGTWQSYPHFFELDRTNGRWTDAGLTAVSVPDGSLQFRVDLQKNEHREFLFVQTAEAISPPAVLVPEAEVAALKRHIESLEARVHDLDQLAGNVDQLEAMDKELGEHIAGIEAELQSKDGTTSLIQGFLFSEPSRTIQGKMETKDGRIVAISRWIEMPVRLRLANKVDAANFPFGTCRGQLRLELRSSSVRDDEAWEDLGILVPLRFTNAGGEIFGEFASGEGLADALQTSLTGRPAGTARYELRAVMKLIPDSKLLPEMSGVVGNQLIIQLQP